MRCHVAQSGYIVSLILQIVTYGVCMASILDIHTPISWSSVTATVALEQIPLAIEQAYATIDNITKSPANYHSTIMGLDDATEKVYRAWNLVQHINSVQNTPEMREAIEQLLPKISDFSSSIFINDALWAVVQQVVEQDKHAPTVLTATQKRHLEQTAIAFQSNGALLSAEQKETLVALNSQLAEKTQLFSNNVLDDKERWELVVDSLEELDGLPSSAIEGAKASALAKGLGSAESPKYRFTLDIPSYFPVLKYANNRNLRKTMYQAFMAVGRSAEYNNIPLITEILELRRTKAQLLGFSNFPDSVLDTRMAKTGSNALQFVEKLFTQTKPFFDAETAELEEYAKAYCAQNNIEFFSLESWDIAYFAEKMQQEQCEMSDELLRPYFTVQASMQGFFDLAEQIFSIRIVEVPKNEVSLCASHNPETVEIWHEDVMAYKIYDQDGSYIGLFYADLFPRQGKRGGAWMNPLYTKLDGEYAGHIGVICGNFTPGINGAPAQLLHSEVETIFHEMGHLLHHMLGVSDVPSLHGTNVAWDFVELPSQIMENWCWETALLERFAKHVDTQENIPAELLEKMLKKRNFRSASFMMRQLSFGKMDLELHLADVDWNKVGLDAFIQDQISSYVVQTPSGTPNNVAQFGHLFSSPVGYASGYYSYKWAEVLDADAFSRFQKEGVLNKQVGMEYRNSILSRGNTVAPEVLFTQFMGREPDTDALLRRAGLVTV